MCIASDRQTLSSAEENDGCGRVVDGMRRVVRVALDGDSAGSAGKQQNGVIGGGIAIDGDAVERTLDGVMKQIGSHTGFEGCIGEQIHQHGGVRGGRRSGLKLGMNHARALGNAGNANRYAAHGKTCHGNLGPRVGGHDGSRHLLQVSRGRAQRGVQCRQSRGQLV